MKKSVGISIGVIVILVAIFGVICLTQPKEEILQEIIPIEGGPSVSIYRGSLTRSGANFSVGKQFAKDKIDYIFNSNYRIDQKKDGVWKKLPLLKNAKKLNTTETYEQGEEWVDWTERYGKLANGEYRYVKSVEKDGKTIYFAEEFIIDDTTPEGRGNRQYKKQEGITYQLKVGTLTREGATFLRTAVPPEGAKVPKGDPLEIILRNELLYLCY